jgi:DNA-binding IclR family transcriptional regulator
MPTTYQVPATVRTINLLELFLRNPEGLTLQEILDSVEISRSSLFALLNTLKTLEYIEQREKRGRYRAGPRLQAWFGSIFLDSQDLVIAFYQEAKSHPIKETMALAVRNGGEITIIAQVESEHRVRSSYNPGSSFAEQSIAAKYILNDSPTMEVMANGYHLTEMTDSIEIGLPVCKDGYYPDAALLVCAPLLRQTSDSFLSILPSLREMAAHLSYRMGAMVFAPYQATSQQTIGPDEPLTKNEVYKFLAGPWSARLACIRPDGTPHVVPIWYEWYQDAFYIASLGESNWSDFLITNPIVSLTIDEPWPPLRRIFARGKANLMDINDLPGGKRAFLNRLNHRYLGIPEQADIHVGDLQAFRIIPEQLKGYRGLQYQT